MNFIFFLNGKNLFDTLYYWANKIGKWIELFTIKTGFILLKLKFTNTNLFQWNWQILQTGLDWNWIFELFWPGTERNGKNGWKRTQSGNLMPEKT